MLIDSETFFGPGTTTTELGNWDWIFEGISKVLKTGEHLAVGVSALPTKQFVLSLSVASVE